MMKKIPDSNYIPILTTESGRCLTMANWQDVGVNMVAYDLVSLLMKPGFEFLSNLPDLATYIGWSGDVVLNATMPVSYLLRSEYDGSRRQYTADEILALIGKLKPGMVLLPEGVGQGWQSLPDSILPFFAPAEKPNQAEREFGVYFLYDTTMSFSSLLQRIQNFKGMPVYVGGELSLPMMRELADLGVQYLASDVPARDACQGSVYCQDEVIFLKDETQRLAFGLLDDQCHCPTCKQQLTRAYLHHLLEHTPLLCQRFLIQHNVYHSSFTHD